MTQHDPDERERDLDDEDTWEVVELPGVAGRTARIATDYDHEELVMLNRAAEHSGEDVISYIRRVSLDAARTRVPNAPNGAAQQGSRAFSTWEAAAEYAATGTGDVILPAIQVRSVLARLHGLEVAVSKAT